MFALNMTRICSTLFSDIFRLKRFEASGAPRDPKLVELSSLVPEFCLQSRSENTVKKYR